MAIWVAILTDIHWAYGAKRGDSTYDDPNITIHDVKTFDNMQKAMGEMLDKEYSLKTDCQQYHDNSNPQLFVRKWNYMPNTIALRMAWRVMSWDARSIKILDSMAKIISEHFEPRITGAGPAVSCHNLTRLTYLSKKREVVF